MGSTLVRLIDFHTNCNCGRDVHAALAVVPDDDDGRPMLALQVQTQAQNTEQRVPVSEAVRHIGELEGPPQQGKAPKSRPAAK